MEQLKCRHVLVCLVLLASCEGIGKFDLKVHPGDAGVADPDGAGMDWGSEDDAMAELVVNPKCNYVTDGTLPGLSIDLTGSPCEFTLAKLKAGVTFTYRVEAEKFLKNVVSQALDPGHCDAPGAAGLRILEKIHGGGQSYCLCDQGLCKDSSAPHDIEIGTYVGTFEWDGANWNGPSDTGTPKGPQFPPGEYVLVVRAEGNWGDSGIKFAETATMNITIVE